MRKSRRVQDAAYRMKFAITEQAAEAEYADSRIAIEVL
jgi:hypothetical protein